MKNNKNIDKLLITESQLLAAVAYCGVNQDPYNLPRKLDTVLLKLKEKIRKEFPKIANDFYIKAFKVDEFKIWLDITLKSIPEFEEWNLSKDEYEKGITINDPNRGKYEFVSAFSTIQKDKDFIDLDACIRNIGLMITRLADY